MSSNSVTMTLEQRIVQNLKDDTLMKLVGDEDAITELVNRAVREALFQKREVKEGYNTYTVSSPVMDAAKKVAEAYAAKAVEALAADDELANAVRDAFLSSLPAAITGQAGGLVQQLMARAQANTYSTILDMKTRKEI